MPTDSSDAEWSHMELHIPTPKACGRPRVCPLHEIFDANFYIVRSGYVWRLLPHDVRPWQIVYHYFGAWHLSGVW